MKQIRSNHNTKLEFSDKTAIDTIEVRNLTGEARRNKLEVLEGALTVENFLSKMISHFFFSQNDNKKVLFDEMVINSDWCSFAAKRKLLNYIINKENLLQGDPGTIVLIKGSQSSRMERVSFALLDDQSRAADLLVRQDPEWLAKK